MKCPHCPSSTLVMTERQGVEIDYCPTCRGIWLDRGELDKLIERSADSQSTSQPQPQPQPAALPQRHAHRVRERSGPAENLLSRLGTEQQATVAPVVYVDPAQLARQSPVGGAGLGRYGCSANRARHRESPGE